MDVNEVRHAVEVARIHMDLGRWQDALDAVWPALAEDDTAYEANCITAHCLGAMGEQTKARAAAERALGVHPEGEWAYRLLAVILLRVDRPGAALREATEAARLAPASVPALHVLAMCQLAVFRRDEAQTTAEAAVAADPQDPLTYLTMARVAADCRRWDEAERAYRDGLRLDPENEELALGLAGLLRGRDRILEAAQVYMAVARSSPTSDSARRAVGEMSRELAKIRSARQSGRQWSHEDTAAADFPPIEAAMRGFVAAASESRAAMDALLKRASGLLQATAERRRR